jgi:hypothetical protein
MVEKSYSRKINGFEHVVWPSSIGKCTPLVMSSVKLSEMIGMEITSNLPLEGPKIIGL